MDSIESKGFMESTTITDFPYATINSCFMSAAGGLIARRA